MSNFDLIDDYLANKLSESERGAFEKSIEANPALKKEVATQRLVVEGIQKVRALELKTMLNNIPVGGSVSLWSDWSLAKVAATIGVAGLLGTTLYFYMNDVNGLVATTPNAADVKIDSMIPKEDEPKKEDIGKEEVKKESEENKSSVADSKGTKSKTKRKPANSPKVDVIDPSAELLTEEKTNESAITQKPVISLATIQVTKDASNKMYSFHYQFWEGKLFLFGAFDESLYEILEVHGDNHALFLFFNDNYYHLDESKHDITALSAIRDRALIQTLKEFRSKM